jgi:hypothetical protein
MYVLLPGGLLFSCVTQMQLCENGGGPTKIAALKVAKFPEGGLIFLYTPKHCSKPANQFVLSHYIHTLTKMAINRGLSLLWR